MTHSNHQPSSNQQPSISKPAQGMELVQCIDIDQRAEPAPSIERSDCPVVGSLCRFVAILRTALAVAILLSNISLGYGQGVQCDPAKVVSAEQCAKCHLNEVAVWKKTPHFQTFAQLSRTPRAKEICDKMGLRSVKRSNVCTACHFTNQQVGKRLKPVSGISCESCHGPARDWMPVHSDYGGPTAVKAAETPEHAAQRFKSSIELGMRNTRDLYSIASSCFNCHTVPNEALVNQGGHLAGTKDFELVRWSQGKVRHNFLRTDGSTNGFASTQRLRLMFVVGLIADLEYSTRATAKATHRSNYGLTVANRAATVAIKLYEVQQAINHPDVQLVLDAFAEADLKINNAEQLTDIANRIQQAGRRFASRNDGSKLQAIDPMLPPPSEYK